VADALPETPARSAYLALVQAHEALERPFRELFKSFGMSPTRFNVLRILVQGPRAGLTCGEIGARLVHRVPDVTRLLDRMERDGLVERHRAADDRRVVRNCITPAGRRACRAVYAPLAHVHEDVLGHLSKREQQQLDTLLRKAFAPHKNQPKT